MTNDDQVTSDTEPGDFGPRASIRRNIFHMMTSQVFTWVLATILAIVVPRFLGPSLQGKLRLGRSLWAVAGIVMAVGTSSYLQIQVARDRRRGLALVGPVLVIRMLGFATCAIGVSAYVASTNDDRTLAGIVALLGLVALFSTVSETFSTAFTGLEQMSTPAAVRAFEKTIHVLGVLLVIYFGGDVFGIVGISVATSVATLVVFTLRFRRITKPIFRGWRVRSRDIISGGLPFMFNNMAVVFYQQIDIFALSWFAGSQDVGWYGTAEVLAGSLAFPVVIISLTTFPTLARLHVEDSDAFETLVQRTFSSLMLIAVPIGLGAILVAPRFAPLLYGEEFRETGTVLAVFGPLIILSFGTLFFANVAQATDRVKVWVLVVLGSALATIPLDLIFVPWSRDTYDNGAIGAAIAQIITELGQFTFGILFVARFLVHRGLVWRMTRVLVAGLVMLLIGVMMGDLPLALIIASCVPVYGFALVVLRAISDDERQLIGQVLERLRVASRQSR